MARWFLLPVGGEKERMRGSEICQRCLLCLPVIPYFYPPRYRTTSIRFSKTSRTRFRSWPRFRICPVGAITE